MELKENPEERMKQVDEIIRNPEAKMDAVMALYSSWNKFYEQDMKEIYKLDTAFDEFEDFVRVAKDARILDVAAGTGLSGQKLGDRGYTNIDALDGSKEMLERAKEKGIYKNFINVILGSDPVEGVEKDSYDLILCVGALCSHHIRYDCFESLTKITKPGGYIYFMGAIEWLFDERDKYEEEMRRLQKEGKWRWVLMKESPDPCYETDQTLFYAFKVL